MKSAELLRRITELFRKAGLEDAPHEAMALLRGVTGIGDATLIAHAPELTDAEAASVMDAASRRAAHEPLQYIMGTVEFMGMTLRVGRGVLVPRPETELLVTEVFQLFPDNKANLSILDLCTGSGCIALALARRYPDATVTATELSGDALHYAHINAKALGADNLRLLKGSLYEPLGQDEPPYDLIASNPPYIPSEEVPGLMPEVSAHEPHGALDGGPEGLNFYREIIKGAPVRLTSGGYLVFELGVAQAGAVSAMAADAGLRAEKVISDFAGHERVIVLRRP